ncbi:metallophosphoesterase family protein [Leifsonia sp. Leaf264]|uniref:metallophosphoesterase family protein n=1 Tax=Leifsonia sp. Leaf264 TaxID=1736314 RepID=UPI000AD4D830|nr:metallophosphoesterase [Leifsonia sp. Leaf264]
MHAPSIDRGDRVIAVAGDWHASTAWVKQVIPKIAAAGVRTILHVGDFGFFRGSTPADHYLDTVSALCAKHDIEIWVTDGNHEDHAWRLELEAAYRGRPAPLRPHVWLLPRNFRWTHAGKSFLSFGGAPSVDYANRFPGRDWWSEEVVTERQVDEAIAAGHADIMVAHDSPNPSTSTIDLIRAGNRGNWPLKALAYAAEGEWRVTRAYDAVQPDLFVHGHYHEDDARSFDDGRTIVSLNRDRFAGNVIIVNLDTLDYEWLDVPGAQGYVRKLKNWDAAFQVDPES